MIEKNHCGLDFEQKKKKNHLNRIMKTIYSRDSTLQLFLKLTFFYEIQSNKLVSKHGE